MHGNDVRCNEHILSTEELTNKTFIANLRNQGIGVFQSNLEANRGRWRFRCPAPTSSDGVASDQQKQCNACITFRKEGPKTDNQPSKEQKSIMWVLQKVQLTHSQSAKHEVLKTPITLKAVLSTLPLKDQEAVHSVYKAAPINATGKHGIVCGIKI